MAVRPINASRFAEILEQWKKDCLQDNDQQSADVISDVILQLDDMPTLTPPNEPLTLEVLAKSQLLQMLGEKVEVIRMGEMCQAEWATVRSFGDCKTDSGCSCCHELYGKTWIAYRRPPNEGAKDKNVPANEPLTLEELREMDEPTPVWWERAGLWCLCERGFIITPNGNIYEFEENNWTFYRRPPEGEEET